MTETQTKVAALSKVTLKMTAGSDRDRMDLVSTPRSLSFIFGIGKEGLTPFEIELADTAKGDTVSFTVARDRLEPFFEHIAMPLPVFGGNDLNANEIHFNVRVEHVLPASGRELVKAMAALVEGCSCGCGCGGHGDDSHDVSNSECGGGCCPG